MLVHFRVSSKFSTSFDTSSTLAGLLDVATVVAQVASTPIVSQSSRDAVTQREEALFFVGVASVCSESNEFPCSPKAER